MKRSTHLAKNRKDIPTSYEVKRVDLILDTLLRLFSKYDERRLSFHSVFNRLLLLVQCHVAFCLLDKSKKAIFYTVTSPHDDNPKTGGASLAEKAEKLLKEMPDHEDIIPFPLNGDGTPSYYLVTLVYIPPNRFFTIKEVVSRSIDDPDRSPNHAAYERVIPLLKVLLKALIFPDSKTPHSIYVRDFVSTRLITNDIDASLQRHQFFRDGGYQKYKVWEGEYFRVLNHDNSEQIKALIDHSVRDRIIAHIYANIRRAPALNFQPSISNRVKSSQATQPFANIIFIVRTATSSRVHLDTRTTYPYALRVVLPERQEKDIARHLEKIAKEKIQCPHQNSKKFCSLLGTHCLFYEADIPKNNVHQVIKNAQMAYGKNHINAIDDVVSSGSILFVDRLEDTSKGTAFRGDPTTEDYDVNESRSHAIRCILGQLSTTPSPRLFISPVRVSNTTYLAALSIIPSISGTDANKNIENISKKELDERELLWLRNFYLYEAVLSRNVNRLAKEYSQESYLESIRETFIECSDSYLGGREVGNQQGILYMTELNKRLFSLAQIIPHPLIFVGGNRENSYKDTEIIGRFEGDLEPELNSCTVRVGTMKQPLTFYLFSTENKFFAPNSMRNHYPLQLRDVVQRLTNSRTLKSLSMDFEYE